MGAEEDGSPMMRSQTGAGERAWIGATRVLPLVSIPAVVAGLYMAFILAPSERTMGEVQRIFYFHVPFAMMAFLAFGIVMVASIGFLARGTRGWDVTAEAAAEVGLLCCTIVLVTGPVWARSAWGVWWTWDARLTSTLVLWLIYAAYLLLRSYMADDPRVRRYAAVLGIVGALDVPIVYFSVHWFRTQHPSTFITKSGGLAPGMGSALGMGATAVFLIFITLLLQRLLIGKCEAEAEALKSALDQRE
jgi:heme exporter protein C